jgi:Flp pilus assembly protein CpaB
MFANYKTWIALTVVFAVAAALTAVSTLQRYARVVPVAAAAHDIQPDRVVTAQDLVVSNISKGSVYQDCVAPQQIAGTAARGFIPAGTVLRASMFQAGPSTIAGKLSTLEGEYAALAVANSLETTVAGAVNPGDRVDIYAVLPGQGRNTPLSRVLLLVDVLVLLGAVSKGDQKDQNQSTQGIILAVSKSDINKVTPYLSNKQGQVVFALNGLKK